jgi:hypothetical protein
LIGTSIYGAYNCFQKIALPAFFDAVV